MSLQDDPLIQEIKSRLNEEIKRTSDWIANGSASTFEEYKKQCGKIIGFNAAIVVIDEAIENFTKDDDD